jgi:hypothetical protein
MVEELKKVKKEVAAAASNALAHIATAPHPHN